MENVYEIVSKQTIIDYISNDVSDERQLKALLNHDDVLNDLYDEWLDTDANFYTSMGFALEDRITEITKDFSKKLNKKSMER